MTDLPAERTALSYETEQRRLDNDTSGRRLLSGRGHLPPEDSHVVLLDDGCRSWVSDIRKEPAQQLFDELLAGGNPLWHGAQLVPYIRERPDGHWGRFIDRRRDTGEELVLYSKCPRHCHGGEFYRERALGSHQRGDAV